MSKIAIVQCEVFDTDVERNLATLEAALHSLSDDTDIVVFPELFLTGFLTRAEIDAVALQSQSDAIRKVEELSERYGVVVSVGFAERDQNQFFNSVAWIQPNHPAKVYRKNYLWLSDVGIFSEGRGGLVQSYQDLNFGIAICFDIEFPETGRALANAGAEVFLVSNGNMQPYGHVHRIAAQARAIENHCYVIMCNRVGSSNDHDFVGDSLVVDPMGKIVVEMGATPGVAYVEIDKEKIRSSQASYCYLEHVRRSARTSAMQDVRRSATDDLVRSERVEP